MDFRMSIVTQFTPDRDLAGIAEEFTTQATLARDGGFDVLVVPEHHVTDDQYLLNEPVIAHLTRDIGSMTLGTGMCLLPYHHPVRIAEYAATMDVLTNGQFRLGIAMGYRQAEFDAFGIDRSDAVNRFEEGIEIIKRLWTEERVTFNGDHFQLDNVTINPKPIQDPRPPIIVGASNEQSVRRAARLTDGWAAGHVPFDGVRTRADAFRDERAHADQPGPGYIEVGREVYVAETTEQAEAIVREPLMRKYDRYMDWGQDKVFEDDEWDSAWDRLKHDRFIVGSPDDVIAEIDRYRDVIDPDCLGVRMQFQGMDPADVHRSIELFATDVIPSFA